MLFLSHLPHITSCFPSSECCTSSWQIRICWKSPQPAASPVYPKSGPPAGNASSEHLSSTASGFFSGCLLQLCLQQQGSHALGVSRVLCAGLSENLPQLPDICPWPSTPPTTSVSSPLMELFSSNENLEQLFQGVPTHPLLLQLYSLCFFHQPLF